MSRNRRISEKRYLRRRIGTQEAKKFSASILAPQSFSPMTANSLLSIPSFRRRASCSVAHRPSSSTRGLYIRDRASAKETIEFKQWKGSFPPAPEGWKGPQYFQYNSLPWKNAFLYPKKCCCFVIPEETGIRLF